ncbi:hypothetical protein CCACVL1_12661, partial [Corchorus capsularis]
FQKTSNDCFSFLTVRTERDRKSNFHLLESDVAYSSYEMR